MPPQLHEVSQTWTPDNTVVTGSDKVLKWDSEDEENCDTDPMYPDDGDDGNAPWYYGVDDSQDDQDDRETDDLDIRASGVPGQNMATPYAKIFGLHYIVHRTGDATYYDPSYGLTATGASNYTSQAVDAWGALYWNPERPANENPQVQWRRRTSSPALDLRLLDQ